jgi:hypothetical protein
VGLPVPNLIEIRQVVPEIKQADGQIGFPHCEYFTHSLKRRIIFLINYNFIHLSNRTHFAVMHKYNLMERTEIDL